MVNRLFSRLAAALIAVAGCLMVSAPANAGLMTLTIEETGFAPMTITSSSLNALTIAGLSYGHFTFSSVISATSNSPNGGTLGFLNLIASLVRDTTSGVKTLTITAIDDRFAMPSNPGLELHSFESTSGPQGTENFQSWMLAPAVYTTGLQPTIGPSASSNTAVPVTIPGGIVVPYTLKNVTVISLGASESIVVSNSTTVVAPQTSVPEPGSMAVWGLGAVCVGVVAAARRRQAC